MVDKDKADAASIVIMRLNMAEKLLTGFPSPIEPDADEADHWLCKLQDSLFQTLYAGYWEKVDSEPDIRHYRMTTTDPAEMKAADILRETMDVLDRMLDPIWNIPAGFAGFSWKMHATIEAFLEVVNASRSVAQQVFEECQA